MSRTEPDSWLWALLTLQTCEGLGGRNNYGIRHPTAHRSPATHGQTHEIVQESMGGKPREARSGSSLSLPARVARRLCIVGSPKSASMRAATSAE